MQRGFIKIPRKLFSSDPWNERRIYSRFEAIVDLYQSADYSSRTVTTSIRALSDRWGWYIAKVQRLLRMLSNEGFIKVSNRNNNTEITVNDTPSDTRNDTRNDTPKRQSAKGFQSEYDTSSDTQSDTQKSTPRAYKNDNIYIMSIEEHKEDTDSSLRSESYAHNSAYENFLAWLSKECPYIAKHYKRMSEAEFNKLKEKYGSFAIAEQCENLENRLDLRKRYNNLYRTLHNWFERDNNGNRNGTNYRPNYQADGHPSDDQLVRDTIDLVDEFAAKRQNGY